MKENKDEDDYLDLVTIMTLMVYIIGIAMCCATLLTIATEDLSFETLKILLYFIIGVFLSLSAPSAIYLATVCIISIKNKIKHYVDVFHYYEELKSDEDRKHLLYNNKSKMKP